MVNASAAGQIEQLQPLTAAGRVTLRSVEDVTRLLRQDRRFAGLSVTVPHPLVVRVQQDEFSVLLLPAALWDRGRELLEPYREDLATFAARLIILGKPEDPELEEALKLGVGAILGADPDAASLFMAVRQALEFLRARSQGEARGRWVTRYRYELGELLEISRAITTEREIKKLLGLILEKSRFITGADAGSVYVVEGTDPDVNRRQLRFKLSQNDSMVFDAREYSMPISSSSMAGYVALVGKTVSIADVYEMPSSATFGFDRSFDDRLGYRTISMLCAPLTSSKGEVIGVLQLINKKRTPENKLKTVEDFETGVIPFDVRSEELLMSLAAQAGIALENALLYEGIRGLFDGFVRASVDAIEARDPTTSGHSRRVADLTTGLAMAVEREQLGPYRNVTWTAEDLRELQYASLLHDFGKIGVRENVLVKAKKLYPHELSNLRLRFDFVAKSMEAELLRNKVQAIGRRASQEELEKMDQQFELRRADLMAAWSTIQTANEPTVLQAGDFQKIEHLGHETFTDMDGKQQPLLTAEEVASLSVSRGSLRSEEYEEIRSHVVHTHRFLSQIPWGTDLARVPTIAGAHHERLNGTGYPNRWRGEDIPLQAKLMSISDIFDALTARDRPYKKAVPTEKALDILGFEVKDQHLDPELVRIFIEAKVWEPVMGALY